MFVLRDYQQKIVGDCYRSIRQGHRKILLFAPTGAGKTVIITKIISDAVSKGRRILFVVHRDVLVSQTYSKLAALSLNCGFFKAGWEENLDAPVQIASVQTLPKRNTWRSLKFDVIVFDECHIVAFSKICQQMMGEIYPNAIYLGLTATPWRLSKKESLGDIYSDMVCAPMPKKLIERGFLVKPSYYALNFEAELEDVELVNGEYNLSQLSTLCDRPELIEQIVNTWYDLAYNRPTIVFTTGVSHGENVAAAFNNHGISAAVVTGKTPIPLRKELYHKLATGGLKVLASCNALSEGFDVPEVSCVLLARPTKSKALYFQQVGRGLRLAEDKTDCLVLDQSRNVLEHGFIEDLTYEDIELLPSNVKRSRESGTPPLKMCPTEKGCGTYIYSFYRKCPHCGFNFDRDRLITLLGTSRSLRVEDEVKLDSYRNLLRQAYSKQYAPSWAAIKFKDEYGFYPPFDWGRGAIFDGEVSGLTDYQNYLQETALRLDKSSEWIDKYLSLEFGKL